MVILTKVNFSTFCLGGKIKMIYGYTRVSTKKQSIERQIRNIQNAFPNSYIIQEAYTGTKIERPYFSKLLAKLKPGDTIVFDSVSRMSRNADEGFKLYEELYSKNIDLIFLNEPQINTTTYKTAKEKSIPLTNTKIDCILTGINQFLLELAREQISLAFEVSEKEVLDLRKRTIGGLTTARLNGVILGHIKSTPLITKKSIKCRELILKHCRDFGGQLSNVECAKLCNCSLKTFYKYKKLLMSERQCCKI